MSTRYDDQGSDSLSYLDDGSVAPLRGGAAGPQVVPAVERGPITLYRVVRKTAKAEGTSPDPTDFAQWRLGSFTPCEELQVLADAYDIGEPVDVSAASSITWFIDYVPPVGNLTTAHVLSCIMEVSLDGARWRPYTLLDNAFTQYWLRGNASQPEPIGVGSFFATRYVYAAEFRSPNMLGADTPTAPQQITRRLDQPEFDITTVPAAPNPPASAPQSSPIGFHLTFDIAPFTMARLRWKHLQVDAAGAYTADGLIDVEDPQNPELNGFVTIHLGTITG